ncbi:MAG TPA: MASE1 domain-containing protein, partial [Saprospiraceae bacterium]|nr:MASE1 domain-containing protein [Saprospiraceae bacterium]
MQKRTYNWLRYFLQVLLTACMYFALARISLLLQFESSNATPVWPSSGIAFALVLLWGVRMTPGILFGAFAANFMVFVTNQTVDYPTAAWLSLVIAIGNTGEVLVGNFLLKKLIPDLNLETFLDKVKHVLRFSLTAALMCIVSSIVGTTTVYAAGIIPSSQYILVLLTWWLGDFSGVLLVTSFILIWLKSFNQYGKEIYNYKKLPSDTILFFVVVIISGGIIFDNWLVSLSVFRWAFWIIPILVWAALSFSQREVITALVIYSLIAIWGTVHHKGPFSYVPLYEALLALQSFIAIMVITKITLNASVLERKKTELILRKTGSELEVRVKNRTSQLEERNQFVETILNSSFESIVVVDKDMRCISINKIARNHMGLPFGEDIVGKKIYELPSFNLPTDIEDNIRIAFQGETVHRDNYASPIANKYFDIDYIPLKNSDGLYAVMIVGHDITQRIFSEQEIRDQKAVLEERNKALQKTNEELSSFAYVASHDLQEPLRKIQIFSKKIVESESDSLSEQGKDFFGRMKSAAERMQLLIEDLLTYSRTGSLSRKFEQIPLSIIIDEVKENLKDELSQKHAVVTSEDLCECRIIPFQFRQLIHNLFSNSLKFSKEGRTPHIIVKSKIAKGSQLDNSSLNADTDYCHIVISDNG